MAIDYGNLRMSLKNLETQHRNLLDLSPDYPAFVHEGLAESAIQSGFATTRSRRSGLMPSQQPEANLSSTTQSHCTAR